MYAHVSAHKLQIMQKTLPGTNTLANFGPIYKLVMKEKRFIASTTRTFVEQYGIQFIYETKAITDE
jgi:hypothetical protein